MDLTPIAAQIFTRSDGTLETDQHRPELSRGPELIRELAGKDGQLHQVYVDVDRARGVMCMLAGLEQEIVAFQAEHNSMLAANAEPWAAAAAILAGMSWTLAVAAGATESRTSYLQVVNKYFLDSLQTGELAAALARCDGVEQLSTDADSRTDLIFADEDGKAFAVNESCFVALATVVDVAHAIGEVLDRADGRYGGFCLARDAATVLAVLSYQPAPDNGNAAHWALHLDSARNLFEKVLHRQCDVRVSAMGTDGSEIKAYLRSTQDMDLRTLNVQASCGIFAFVYPAITQLLAKVLAEVSTSSLDWVDAEGDSGADLARLFCVAMMWRTSIATSKAREAPLPHNEAEQLDLRHTLELALHTQWDFALLDNMLPRPSKLVASTNLHGLH